jgi:hypothetical protein
MSTAVRNQIHTLVDRLFPGFLDEKKSGIVGFTKSSLHLMQDRFSAKQISRRRQKTLVAILWRHGTSNAAGTAAKLKKHASQVLTPSVEHIDTLQISLAGHVRHFKCLKENINQLEKEMAIFLAQTPGAFLTSVRGIGLVLAAGVTAEIGDPNEQKPVSNLVSYAGIIPRVKQSGGPDGKTITGRVSKRCNRILKDYVVKSGVQMGLRGPEDLKRDHRRRDAQGQHADFGIARRYLRIGVCLMRTSQIYLPPDLRREDTTPEERADYYLTIWPYFKEKWRKYGALDVAFEKNRPLGLWRHIVQSLYDIKLKL